MCTEFQRRIPIRSIKALTKSLEKGNDEFIVHVQDQYDYRFICEVRDELFEQIKACYFRIMNSNVPVFGVPDKLKEFETSKKDVKAGVEKMPPDDARLKDEDLYEPLGNTSMGSSPLDEDELPVMGNHRPTFAKKGDMNVSLSDFQIKSVVGRGTFGKVFLVQKKDTGEVYAMKSLRKDVIIEYDQVESTKLEKEILLQADHPFLVGMSYVFQTD